MRQMLARMGQQGPFTQAVTYIPLKVHVLRRSDGSGGISNADLNQTIVSANINYYPASIQFYLCGEPDYINSDTYYDYNYNQEDGLCAGNDVVNAINVYYLDSITFGTDGNVSGYAYYPSSMRQSNRVFVTNTGSDGSRALSHEMGHYFGLYHTFNNNANADVSQRELVRRDAGANCSTAGDFVCDTPADPFQLPGATVSTATCTYSGTIVDAQTMPFTPALDNIMSYYYGCGNVFTAGQFERIRAGMQIRLTPDPNPAIAYHLDCAPATIAGPTGLSASPGSTGVTLHWTNSSSAGLGLMVERSTNTPDNFRIVGGTTVSSNTFTDFQVASQTTYHYRVKPSSSTTNGYSNVALAAVDLVYCVPVYSVGCPAGPVLADFSLANTPLANLNSGCSPNSYGDFTTTSTTVTAGQAYTFTATFAPNTNQPGQHTYYPQYVALWLDTNQDGVFSPTEQLYASGPGPAVSVIASFTIPAGSATGLTRMRVRTRSTIEGPATDACTAYQFGETEDYALFIQTPAPAPQPVCLSVKVLLEGPLNPTTGLMRTTLNQRGLLPGQTPIGEFGVPTPAGQPYNRAPWNYTVTASPTTYATDVVDWVLVSLRSSTASPATSQVYRTAGLLKRNGTIDFGQGCPVLDPAKSYYVVVEHRNHLGAMSPTALPVVNGLITFDFTTTDTYRTGDPLSNGQRLVNGRYALYAADVNKTTRADNFDINYNDNATYRLDSNRFDTYLSTDFNLDADVNFTDKGIWRRNSGNYSSVAH